MNLDRYVVDLHAQLAAAAERSGEESESLVAWLGSALDSTVRLVLIEALSDAAGEVSAAMAPAAVEVRMRGREPELVLVPGPSSAGTLGASDSRPAELWREPGATVPADDGVADDAPSSAATVTDDATMSRTTLRLPETLKDRAERAAQDEGLSLNAWLVRAVATALEPKGRRDRPKSSRSSYSGWVR